MKSKVFTIYLSFVLIVIAILAYSVGLFNYRLSQDYSKLMVTEFTRQYENGPVGRPQDFNEFKIDPSQKGLYTATARIEKSQLQSFSLNCSLLITRLRGNWHRIYFNNALIGQIGSSTSISNNLWHSVYMFQIDPSLIQEQNTLKIITYTDYKWGFGFLPIIMTHSDLAYPLYTLLYFQHNTFYGIVIVALIALSTITIVLFLTSQFKDYHYLLLPLSTLLAAIYLLDYGVISYAPLSPLIFKKIVLLALYGAMTTSSYVLAQRFHCKWLKWFSLMAMAVAVISFSLASDLLALGNVYNILNFLMLIMPCTWIFISLKSFTSSRDIEDFMLFMASVLLLVPCAIDTYSLLDGQDPHLRYSSIGILFFSIAALMISLVHYIEVQKQLYASSRELDAEKKRLTKALSTDDLTQLGNHRYFYERFLDDIAVYPEGIDVLFIDIDKFRAINNSLGHVIGDQIIKRIAAIIQEKLTRPQDAFRYGGEEFVALLPHAMATPVLDLAESIRQSVMQDDQLHLLCSYYPVSVSIGIAAYPHQSPNPRAVVRKAEKATEYAKLQGRNAICHYSKTVEEGLETLDQTALKRSMITDFALTLASTIDLRDVYTGKHSEEVTRYALLLADALHLSTEDRYTLRLGSLLHDIGKIAISDAVLRKTERLTDQEYGEIKTHVTIGSDLIKDLIDDSDVIACVRYHHEKFDGSGYPDGLDGHHIPLNARIVCIADAFHAMVSNRPYRKGMALEAALDQLRIHSNTQFDPHLVELFLLAIDQRNA